MRPRRAAPAPAILAVACLAALAAACTGSGGAPPAATPTATPAATAPAAAPTATPTPAPSATATATPPTATPTPSPTPTATPTPATATPTPATKRYNRLDATGEAATPGSWAILGADGGVLTDWEALRADAATLRIHQTDAGGTSWATEFGAVEAGGIIEWRKADDCWVRYRVTGAPTRPASGSSRWEFPVEWMTYAATGAGCTGAVGAATVLRVDEGAPSVVRTSGIASPVRHGPYLIAPAGWTGAIEESVRHEPSAPATGGASGASATATPSPVVITQDLAEARRLLPYWRDPVLPAGWTFSYAEAGTDNAPPPATGYCAVYREAIICVGYKHYRPSYTPVLRTDGSEVYETRTIDGHAALVRYSPPGPAHNRYLSVRVQIFDADTGIEYGIIGSNLSLSGSNVEAAVAITRSLIPKAGAP